MELTINVKIGISDRMELLLRSLFAAPVEGVTLLPESPVSAPATATPDAAVPAKKKRKGDAAQEAPAIPASAPAPPTVEEAPAALPVKEEEAPPAETPTAEDVRAAMHRTRQRIEGENYKDNPDSEGVKKYHRALNGEFKRISALLGADKPSILSPEQRGAFINECDQLILDEKGNITKKEQF